MKISRWIISWILIIAIMLGVCAAGIIYVDPYFQYRKPRTDEFYYELSNQRSQNYGICRSFDYDALVTGTSMVQNTRVSEINELFGVNAVKVCCAGASYKELNNLVQFALEHNKDLKLVIRGLDTDYLTEDADVMRENLGSYPDYLYDDDYFNDLNYVLNRDVFLNRVVPMFANKLKSNFVPGITAFDDYSACKTDHYGIHSVTQEPVTYYGPGEPIHMDSEMKTTVYKNVTQNITDLADAYPDVDFYYYFTPYSVACYKNYVANGDIYARLEAQKYAIELILQHENIHLFSVNGREDIICDYNNYKDFSHYGVWINSVIYRGMTTGENQLTKDNYKKYINDQLTLFTTYDYESVNEQEDLEDDWQQAAKYGVSYEEDITKLESSPDTKVTKLLSNYDNVTVELNGAEYVEDQYEGTRGFRCVGRLQRGWDDEMSLVDYIKDVEYIGAKVSVNHVDKNSKLIFWGKQVNLHGQALVYVFNEDGKLIGSLEERYGDVSEKWTQYSVDLGSYEGPVTIYFNGGYEDSSGNADSEFIFSGLYIKN